MLHIPLNPCPDAIAGYDELVAATVRRYGPTAQGVGYVLHEELIFLREQLAAAPTSVVIAARIAAVREALATFYRSGDPDTVDDATTVVRRDPFVVEFERETFRRRRYHLAADEVRAETVLASPRMDAVTAGAVHLYVIDDESEIRVWRRPFRAVDLMFSRQRPRVRGVPVAHPMLVPERLRAMAAGEVVFVGQPRVVAAVVNTKSGHFRPPPATAGLVRRRFQDVLGLGRRDLDVIVVGNGRDDGDNLSALALADLAAHREAGAA